MVEKMFVNTQSGRYPVVVGENLDFGKLALDVKKPCRLVVVSDDKVFPLYGDALVKSFVESGYKVSGYIVDNGESSKRMDVVTRLLRFLVDQSITRQDILVALGGGGCRRHYRLCRRGLPSRHRFHAIAHHGFGGGGFVGGRQDGR